MRARLLGGLFAAVLWAVRKRDEAAIRSALIREDWDGYAMAQMAHWRRWRR